MCCALFQNKKQKQKFRNYYSAKKITKLFYLSNKALTLAKHNVMKIDFNFNLKDLDGVEIPNANVGKLVASILVESNKGDAIKCLAWATKFHAGKVAEFDMSDYQTLKAFVETNEKLTNLSKGQILEYLATASEKLAVAK